MDAGARARRPVHARDEVRLDRLLRPARRHHEGRRSQRGRGIARPDRRKRPFAGPRRKRPAGHSGFSAGRGSQSGEARGRHGIALGFPSGV